MTAVKGYRPLDEDTLAAMNENKVAEEVILRKLDEMVGCPDVDQRWLALGRTHIEQGFMAINRSLARPGRLVLEGDL